MITSPERELEIIGIHFYLLYKKKPTGIRLASERKTGLKPATPSLEG